MPDSAVNTLNFGSAVKKASGRTGTTKQEATRRPSVGKASERPRRVSKSTKTDQVLQLLKRSKGASVPDLMKATGWQAHSIRGFLSGAVKKKMGLTVVSEKDAKGVRRYRIAKDTGS